MRLRDTLKSNYHHIRCLVSQQVPSFGLPTKSLAGLTLTILELS